MSGLRELLATPDRVLGRLKVRAPELRELGRAVAALDGTTTDAASLEDTAMVQHRLMRAVCDGQLADLGQRDLREACKTLFHPPLTPGRDPTALSSLIEEVRRRGRQGALLALVNTYVDAFSANDPDLARLASRLEAVRHGWDWRAHDPWPGRAERFALFDPARAPGLIADCVLQGEGLPATLLAEAGLDTAGRLQGGLGLTAFQAACANVETRDIADLEATQERLIAWAFPTGRGKDLLLPEAWPELAGALFAPWADDPPGKEHQARISDLAIDYAGDPRTLPPRWRRVEQLRPDALRTLKRWLVRASVLQFFDIVDSVADARMWRYRSAFWKAYVEADHVDDAWIVFGTAGMSHARAAADRLGEPALRQFGRLEPGANRGPNHACLLMRIGDLTIAEWSHNGRCYIWRRDTPKPPKLGQSRYYPDELAHPQSSIDGGRYVGIAHMAAESYGWQRKVASHIADQTGLRTHQRDWAP